MDLAPSKSLMLYDHMVIAASLLECPFSADGQGVLTGHLQGGGVLVSRVKGQCLKVLSLKKRKKSHHTCFLKAVSALKRPVFSFELGRKNQ